MLTGREPEIGAIVSVLERAAAGTSEVLVLRGDAGLGKTVLLDEAARRAEGFRVLRAAGYQSETELPYAAAHQLLQPLLDRVDALPGPQARALRAAFGLDVEARADAFLVGLAVLTLLSQAAEDGPVLCLLDDVQWIDRESVDALTFAARRVHGERLAIVWAARDAAGTNPLLPDVHELRLAPLSRAEATELLAARHGDRLGAGREGVLELAAGNPLALVELADAAAEGVTGATTVEQTYRNSIRALPPDTQTLLLLAASCAGGIGAVAAAGELVGVDVAALEPAELAGLVRVEERAIVFKHPLVRAVAYEDATFAQRRSAHLAFAAILDTDDEADRRAWHRAAATVGEDEEVAALLEESAGRAIARSGHGTAATALERAARLSPADADRVRRLVRAAASACTGGQRERALTLLEEVHDSLHDIELQIEAARVRGVIEAHQGSPAAAMRIFLDAASAAYGVDRLQALTLVTLAQEAAGLAGAHDAVLEFAEWADRFGVGEGREEEIMLGLVRGFAAIAAGDPAGAAPHLARAAEGGRSVDEPRLLIWAATAAMFLGDDPCVLELLRRAVRIARARGASGELPFALHLLAGVERRLGDFAGAEADADESRRLAVETGQSVVAAGALSTLTALAALRGDVDLVETLAAETRALAEPRGLPVALAGVERALAELDLARGRAADALDALESGGRGSDERRRNHPYTLFSAPLVVEAAARAGAPHRAGPYLEAFERWVEAGGLDWAKPLLARCRALLASDGAEADAWFVRALELHAVTRHRFETARTQLLYGEVLRRARRKREARGQLREALATFEGLGARMWAERALAELRATGVTARKRDESTRGELTAQELQIVRLVALGQTNPDVAAQLFVSPKTVQYHLRKVFAKLGISSRIELTGLVVRGQIPGAVAAADAA